MPAPTNLRRTVLRQAVPAVLITAAGRPRASVIQRVLAATALLAVWTKLYRRYRREGKARTRREWDLLRTASWEAYTRHYNERVPTIEEEFDIWGEYHQHRHEMRYDLVADAVRHHVPAGGRILDVGCGSALVADRILDIRAHYIGVDFGGHHTTYAAKRLDDVESELECSIGRCDGELLPFPDATFDVVVMSEVIEHLLQPERAVWEVARVLRPGGVFVMTTNNASEMPLRSPLSNPFAWIEKALAADRPELMSLRPWIWPEPVASDLVPEGAGKIYLPHTHHIQAETRSLFAAAGMDTFSWSTFEFPPPQSATASWLDRHGEPGRRAVDILESVAQRTPLVRRLGCHLFMLARKTRPPVAPSPPDNVWPGPFSGGQTPA